MRLGQTSIVVFLSNVLASAIGFVGTVYFARVLGPAVIGIYATIVALLTWLQLGGKAGLHEAITKRLSEGEDRGEYLAAAIITASITCLILITALFVFRGPLNAYLHEFNTYTDISVVWFILLLFIFQVAFHLTTATLSGQHLVHVVGLLRPVRTGLINGFQFTLVFFFGLGIVGLLLGHIAGLICVMIVGTSFVSVRLKRPNRRHFARVLAYAKFSWFGELSSRTFSNADILILGLFVPANLVGIYSVAWMLSSVLSLFGGAIGSTMFPEISNAASHQHSEAVAGMIEDSVAYAGFVVIPGTIGGVILGDRIFKIYGSGFGLGTHILGILLVSILAYSYLSQFRTALNGLDRPDLVFGINVAFVLTNIVLNVVLITAIGWVGAAIASAVSTTLGMGLGYYLLSRIMTLDLPVAEIGREVLAALGMGLVVWGVRVELDGSHLIGPNLVVVLLLVTLGASVYVLLMVLISTRFRGVVRRNLPWAVPL